MFCTASSAKHEVVRTLGGFPVDYRIGDFVAILSQRVPEGFDAILDPVGPENWKRSARLMKKNGRLVAFGGLFQLGTGALSMYVLPRNFRFTSVAFPRCSA